MSKKNSYFSTLSLSYLTASAAASVRYDHQSIRDGVEQDAAGPNQLFVQAAVCECAERVQTGNFAPNLDGVLFPEAPKRLGPPLGAQGQRIPSGLGGAPPLRRPLPPRQ